MSRLLLSLLEALGLAFCERGRKCLHGYVPFGVELQAVAEATLKELRKHMPTDQIRVALEEAASFPPEEFRALLEQMIKNLCRVKSVPFKNELQDYLLYLPLTIRQMFHRPSDPRGVTAPAKLDFYKPEQLLPFLPPRRPHHAPGTRPEGLEGWELRELRGLGECGEVWIGHNEHLPHHSPAALKFPIEKESIKRFQTSHDLFRSVFELNEIAGIVPLRTVFLESNPPCLEYAFVSGYDLTGLMHEWRWNYDHARPDMTLKLMKRIAETVGKAHARGVVHRDLKPSNIIIHPLETGRFSLWITDFGWGQIESQRSMELYRLGATPKADQERLSLRGAYTPLYASPQQTKNELPAPTDDVHALGVIWYQLLKRDPHASAPVGEEWAEDFYHQGLTKSQAKLISACVATRPDRRPPNAQALAEMIAAEMAQAGTEPGRLRTGSSSTHVPLTPPASPAASATVPAGVPSAAVAAGPAVGSAAAAGQAVGPPAASAASAATALPATPKVTTEKAPARQRLIRNAVGMSFVLIPAGTFRMGADPDEAGHRRDETPQHTVTITRPFYLSITPVTQAHYERLTGRNCAFFHARNGGSHEFPLENISWFDAERFCQRLSKHPDEVLSGRSYRLPTEAEWEYACRAGTTTPFSFGERLQEADAHFAAFTRKGQGKPCPVGIHPPNPWGLQDMHGNVDEWVSDWYSPDYYATSPPADPQGPPRGEHKVARGGDWAGTMLDCRSAARKHLHPDKPLNTVGFRVVMLLAE